MNKESQKQFDEVLVKPIGLLNEFDVAILRARRSYLSDKQIEDYSEVLKEKEEEADANYSKMNKKQLLAVCEEKGITNISATAKNAEIVALIEAKEEENFKTE